MQLIAKAFHRSANMLKLRKLAESAIPGAIKKLVLVLPFTNRDYILLALLQGGLRVQLSGLEPEIREGEKSGFQNFSSPVGASYKSYKRFMEPVSYFNQIVG